MDKITFLAALSEKLTKFPLSDEEINICINRVTEYLSTVTDEDFVNENHADTDADEMAKTVYDKYMETKSVQDSSGSDTETAKAQDDTSESASPEEDDEEPEDVLAILAREAEEERENQKKIEDLKRLAIERAIAENDEILVKDTEADNPEKTELLSVFEEDSNDPVIEAVDSNERPDIAYEEAEAIKHDAVDENEEANYLEESDKELLVDAAELKTADTAKKKSKDKPEKKEKIEGTPVFWTIFILLIPIICPILLAVAGVFAAAYIAVTAIIAALCLSIVGIVATGTIVALVGIIYGAIETFKVAPLGMFEVGLGITVGGITMLLSVLLYNVAIRFAPMLYACLTKLVKLVTKQICNLYIKAKKECGR